MTSFCCIVTLFVACDKKVMEANYYQHRFSLFFAGLYLASYFNDYKGNLDFSSFYYTQMNQMIFPSTFPRNESVDIAKWRDIFSMQSDNISNHFIGVKDVHTNLYSYPEPQLMRIYNSNQTDNNAPDEKRRDVLLWLHDGAWMFGGAQYEDEICFKLAQQTGFVVVSASYRLAPEYPYPTPFNDALRALSWVRDNIEQYGAFPMKIVVGGEGAGANLAAAIVARNLDLSYVTFDDRISVIGLLLVHPPLEMHMHSDAETGSYAAYGQLNGLMTTTQLDWAKAMYRSTANIKPTDYAFAPLVASPHLLKLFPNTVIVLAKHDILFDEGVKFGHILKKWYVPVDTLVYNSTIYGFFGRSVYAQGNFAMSQVTTILRRISGTYPVEHFIDDVSQLPFAGRIFVRSV